MGNLDNMGICQNVYFVCQNGRYLFYHTISILPTMGNIRNMGSPGKIDICHNDRFWVSPRIVLGHCGVFVYFMVGVTIGCGFVCVNTTAVSRVRHYNATMDRVARTGQSGSIWTILGHNGPNCGDHADHIIPNTGGVYTGVVMPCHRVGCIVAYTGLNDCTSRYIYTVPNNCTSQCNCTSMNHCISMHNCISMNNCLTMYNQIPMNKHISIYYCQIYLSYLLYYYYLLYLS